MKRSIFGIFAGCFFIAMAIFPQSVYVGARQGLDLWAQVLVPSMLPFFILAEILMGSGLLQKLGFLMSPIMQPLFHLPGTASLGIVLGFTSGFPMGAVMSSRLYEEGYLNKQQASRILAFTNNSSPGFIVTTVAAGMLNSPNIGWLLALCHYGANLIYGFLIGHLPTKAKLSLSIERNSINKSKKPTALPLSTLITESIRTSIQNILTLGGFVLIFSAGLQLFQDLKLLWPIAALINNFLPNNINQSALSQGLASGLFEMTLGLSKTSQVNISLSNKVFYSLILLGWSGFSIQAQVIGIVGGSGLQLRYYLAGRIIQPVLSILLLQIIFLLL